MSRADLETALLHELARTWRHLNGLLFHKGMRPPAFTLSDGTTRVAEWRPSERTIAISRSLLADQPWAVVVEVLKHEMAHQYVGEVIKPTGESAHGPAFRMICDRLGIDARARGMPVADAMDPGRQKALRKVQALLALAESDNEHEAEAAMARAHALMRKHNIAWTEEGTGARYVFRQIGAVRSRIPAHERVLAGLLARHFFVESIWIWVFDQQRQKEAKALELSGTAENVDMAEYVHAFLLRAATRLWAARSALPGGKLGGRGAKGRFMTGVVMGFDDKLELQAQHCEQEEGLVWLGDPGLDDFVGRRHPRLRKVRSASVRADAAFTHGHKAGRNLVLHRPVHGSTSRGRQLGVGE